MRKNINTENIKGRVYDHDLTLKTVQNQTSANYGKPFIQGSISVATDDAGLNVIPVHYTYVTEMTKNNKPNITYSNLKKVMEGKTWVNDGPEQAMKVRLVPSIALNDFYPNGGDELVSQVRNEGGFVNIINDLGEDNEKRREFKLDVVINGVEFVENDEEDYVKVRCAAFNFRNDLLPLTLVAKESASAGSVNYFMNLDFDDGPVYTNVWGEIVNTTVKIEKTIESAFGTPTVDVSERSQREYVITGARPEPYVFDDAETMTVKELEEAIAKRNIYLEEVKTRAKEYYANQESSTPTSNENSNIPEGGFNF